MKKTALILFACLCLGRSVLGTEVKAISPSVVPTIEVTPTIEVVRENITEVSTKVVTDTREVKWKGWNSVEFVVTKAINRGVPANTIVLLLLLPLVATLVSILHYWVGLSGYGIFTPTMMAVAFLATGIVGGLSLFVVILAITLLSNIFLKKMKLHFWPARSITLSLVGVGTFVLMAGVTYLRIFDVSKISIFPILFMILLTEEFVRTQLAKSKKEAIRLTVGTLILATVGTMTMEVKGIQELVLSYPELVILLVVVVNILIGSYGGMRITEIKRFKNAIRKK